MGKLGPEKGRNCLDSHKIIVGFRLEPGFIQWYSQGISEPNSLYHCLVIPTHDITFYFFFEMTSGKQRHLGFYCPVSVNLLGELTIDMHLYGLITQGKPCQDFSYRQGIHL